MENRHASWHKRRRNIHVSMKEIQTILCCISGVCLLAMSIQSLRLYLKSKVVPALSFAVFYAAFAILSSISAVLLYKSGAYTQSWLIIGYFVALGVMHLSCLQLATYTTIRNRFASLAFFVLGSLAVVVEVIAYSSRVDKVFFAQTTQTQFSPSLLLASSVPLLVIVFTTVMILRQITEVISQPLASFRLVLIALSIVALGVVTLSGALQQRSIFVYTAFVFILALVAAVLALTSLLTPIGSRTNVERPIY